VLPALAWAPASGDSNEWQKNSKDYQWGNGCITRAYVLLYLGPYMIQRLLVKEIVTVPGNVPPLASHPYIWGDMGKYQHQYFLVNF